ncbi:MAG: hypothetical protein ACI9B8_003024 [Sulfitobacter sp.]|jgi:hypothetical protein
MDDDFKNLSVLLIKDNSFIYRAIGLENFIKAANGRSTIGILSTRFHQITPRQKVN